MASIPEPNHSILGPNQSLGINEPDQALVSSNGQFELDLQSDGNLVLYRLPDGYVIWASETNRQVVMRATMQVDGDLVLYDSNNRPVWASNTNVPGSFLQVQDDGNVVIYRPDGGPIWVNGTNR